MKARATQHLAGIFVAVILLFHIIVNLAFIAADKRPANINELSHVISAIDFNNLLIDQPDVRAAYLIAFSGYPPAGVAASAAYAILGRRHDSAQISQLFFSIIAIIGLYALGRRLFGRATGVLAAAFFVLSPAVCEVSRQYLLEWPLTGLSTLAVFFLWKSEGMRNKPYAYLAGAAIGLAALAKQTFFVFLAGPMIVTGIIWLSALRDRAGSGRTERTAIRWALAALSLVAAPALALFLYPQDTRNAIDVWFAISAGMKSHWGALFAVAMAVMIAGVGISAALASGPLGNALGGAGLVALTASVWYFPKGIGNWLTYAGQMRMNVATMSPLSLMNFYYQHLTSYYLGVAPCLAMLPVLASILVLFAARKRLSRHFFRSEKEHGLPALAFCLSWLLVPAAAFFFINIQNEMNTVPIMPSMALVQAFLVTRLFLPYNRRRLVEIESGRRPPASARITRIFFAVVGGAVVAVTLAAGLASALIFPTGRGAYAMLPSGLERNEKLAALFPRKRNTLNYLVPLTADWSVEKIADLIDREVVKPAPRVLSMDVDFYFSWNTFWYEFKLRNRNVIVETQWDNDRDILGDPSKDDYIAKYDAVIYRLPWRKVYESARNDYIEYRNLWKTYEYLENPPDEFRALFLERGRFDLPDGTTAVVLIRKS